MAEVRTRAYIVEDPPLARLLFGSTALAWIWLVVRVWLGYQWIQAGLHKVSDPGWVQTGVALRGFWERAVSIPAQGRPPIAFGWYRDFIEYLLGTKSHT